jgi:hypothetical protein
VLFEREDPPEAEGVLPPKRKQRVVALPRVRGQTKVSRPARRGRTRLEDGPAKNFAASILAPTNPLVLIMTVLVKKEMLPTDMERRIMVNHHQAGFGLLFVIVAFVFLQNASQMLRLNDDGVLPTRSLVSTSLLMEEQDVKYDEDDSSQQLLRREGSASTQQKGQVQVGQSRGKQQFKPIPPRRRSGQKDLVKSGDFIYYKDLDESWDASPVVIESHKLIFFTIPKVGRCQLAERIMDLFLLFLSASETRIRVRSSSIDLTFAA